MADNLAHPYNRRKSLLCTGIISQRLPADRCDVGRVLTIDDLPDDDLLAIFYFCVVSYQDLAFFYPVVSCQEAIRKLESWQSLVHVCRRWRCLVFGSPRRLNLQLYCTPGTSAMKSLDVWPALPLFMSGVVTETSVDNVIAELKHSDRICQIDLQCDTTLQIENLLTAMQVPFPELAVLYLYVGSSHGPVLPDSFLGGSAPRLRSLGLDSIPFPGLLNLLLSATNLVTLSLYDIPHSGYISPEAMVTCLSLLTSLNQLDFQFNSPQSCPDQETRRPPPPTRSIFPALLFFSFKGVNEYLEDLVSWIDSPRLRKLEITFFNDIDFNTPELDQFITRTPSLGANYVAHLIFYSHEALVRLLQFQPERLVHVSILCQVSDWQLSSLAQICTFSLHPFLTMENLYIYENLDSPPNWKDDIENTEWLDLLLPFTAVKNLYLSNQFSPRIAPALLELTGGRATEVLPALQNVLLEGYQPSEPVQEGITQFISARRLTNHPVVISAWDRDL
jgi:hypothetical protein